MNKRCLIMAGGTGGHVFPGIAVANELTRRGWHIDWLGTAERMEAQVVPAHGFPIHFIPVKGLRGKGIVARLSGVLALVKSLLNARKLLQELKPDVVIGMGGYASGPGGIAAKTLGIPVIIHEQNAVPGMTNKLLARIAEKVMLGFASAQSYFGNGKDKCQVVGNPVRHDILAITPHTETATPMRMLVIGGSLGARPLNEQLPQICQAFPGLVIRHQCGKGNEQSVREAYGKSTATVTEFINDMAAAYDWADFVVCRAGALTVAEIAAAGKPAIFVPLPHAVDDHQTLNARSLADQNAAKVVAQAALGDELPVILRDWLENPADCVRMAANAKQFAPYNAAEQVADACEALTKER
ncbi:undecaprenyldiphospho-muramoylpentapeptide beta-N-acetylglucosaminyltransferase [Alteromonas lipolytica]|uniref:UDP-N-acetylglucosamine--N-acetylmuramyl-(pentapeptide) pyrophosphoryl-undecaprenol N-acetylglucosamine transferase n=1 Tax=Alteromonas lipolytica TaxID=1856405 RepID=A0A1E8FAV3_9ALTE|nr:undecaprenyldiphospho-muramoylpentapeptide beta-N-acetylglucosaminyltransferase [Alteromonas lipolytica]OFI32633.1 undecaprenyldiphospho-muramoylpentapeptide beta-N-acetylglucosaminyltransferase [Alteromonas lipolytica]GGF74531.1 UDP-N-acetylglucosamine--N-acetylmuramyl-(pentapeptide) pyrophosphoryl-undecaprenol N-acetylglucosamine transferase [Alteromonas lipolytica]